MEEEEREVEPRSEEEQGDEARVGRVESRQGRWKSFEDEGEEVKIESESSCHQTTYERRRSVTC